VFIEYSVSVPRKQALSEELAAIQPNSGKALAPVVCS
jgi:hypothetical protein